MGMDLQGFNANDQEDFRGDFEVLPAGVYLAWITESEEKQNSKGTGSYLALTFEVIEPEEHKGRKLFVNLNLNHPNETAVRIAKAELGAIGKATGVTQPTSSEDFHEIPIAVKVKIEKRKDNGEFQNRIAGYYPKAEYGKGGANGRATAPAGPKGAKPWAR